MVGTFFPRQNLEREQEEGEGERDREGVRAREREREREILLDQHKELMKEVMENRALVWAGERGRMMLAR